MLEKYVRTQYLRVIGRLYPDLRLALRPCYLTSNPPWSEREGDSPLRADCFDDSGAPLGSFPLRLSEQYLEGSSEEMPQAVRGYVPFHPSARRVVFTFRGQRIHEILRSETAPRTDFNWHPADPPTGEQVVTWEGEHPEGLPVQYFLRFSNDGGETWNRIGIRTEAHEQVIDFDQLPGGERCQLALVATDGINTTINTCPPFFLPRKPCIALITHPLDGATYPAGQPILLLGQGYWRETAQPEWEQLEWHTSNDAEPVGRGSRAEVTLPPGQHTITLLTGSDEYRGSAEVVVRVE